ncbi:hypothetical protein CSV79_04375 [Sporosarcina sp. P13]|uniref:capping complex subunit for YIEGIA n=1 Tax=Sporosarcina sp. P13 TaxID=2048263 RepID=UPI000C165BFD|nr:hypothetical protein [Sporosarcina sp. P13]PIC64862.1 hypothetical protein CSV79_04375 [Sporosarcina sp. P13]
MENQHAEIVAVVTMKRENVVAGGATIFIVKDPQELQITALTLEKVLDATSHEIDADTLIVVAH